MLSWEERDGRRGREREVGAKEKRGIHAARALEETIDDICSQVSRHARTVLARNLRRGNEGRGHSCDNRIFLALSLALLLAGEAVQFAGQSQ